MLKPIQDPNEMDLAIDAASSRVGLDATTMAQALASYVRSILSGDAPYDRFINGDRAALSPEQRAGLQIFRGKGNCTACHVGPTFTDERLHNTGVAWRDGRLNPNRDAEIRPLHLTASEKGALIAFLHALSGTVSEGVDPRGRREPD